MSAPVGKVKATFNMDARLHEALKIRAALERRTMGEIINEVISVYYPITKTTAPKRHSEARQ